MMHVSSANDLNQSAKFDPGWLKPPHPYHTQLFNDRSSVLGANREIEPVPRWEIPLPPDGMAPPGTRYDRFQETAFKVVGGVCSSRPPAVRAPLLRGQGRTVTQPWNAPETRRAAAGVVSRMADRDPGKLFMSGAPCTR
jgi:hypothetical protein